MAYSQDLKQRAVDAYNNGEGNYAEIGRRFCVSRNTVRKWVLKPNPPAVETRGRPPALKPDDLERLRALAIEHFDASETELAAKLAGPDHKPLHRSIIHRALRKIGLTRKKRHGEHVSSCKKTSKTHEENG